MRLCNLDACSEVDPVRDGVLAVKFGRESILHTVRKPIYGHFGTLSSNKLPTPR